MVPVILLLIVTFPIRQKDYHIVVLQNCTATKEEILASGSERMPCFQC
jgi:hypothetical protein